MGTKARTIPKEYLVNIKQGGSEALKSYLNQFSKQIMEVEEISDDTALMVPLSGLRPKIRFWWSVREDEPQTYVDS